MLRGNHFPYRYSYPVAQVDGIRGLIFPGSRSLSIGEGRTAVAKPQRDRNSALQISPLKDLISRGGAVLFWHSHNTYATGERIPPATKVASSVAFKGNIFHFDITIKYLGT